MLETERLELIPLSAEQLTLWTRDLAALERELGCAYRAERLEGELLEAVAGQIEKVAAEPEHTLYRTFWLMLRRDDRVAVGSACFKDVPDEAGRMEIGYGVGQAFENQGYATEAARALCRWALEQPGVGEIVAETERDNLASQRVLAKCGMGFWREEGDSLWWSLKKG